METARQTQSEKPNAVKFAARTPYFQAFFLCLPWSIFPPQVFPDF
jgi:hypothetical protein